ncbi:MAG: M28 family peptidase [Bacteroidia bacterium]|nr:M28 family peptidase [Bacteroidia bacterium]MDW8236438.1 M28 family peptidase [Bacteroidia bacterium]
MILLSILWLQVKAPLLLERLYTHRAPLDTVVISQLSTQVSEKDLYAHLQFLAHDALQGREAGTPFEKVAAAYLIAQHRRIGNEPLLPQSYIHVFWLKKPISLPPPEGKSSRKKKKLSQPPPPSPDSVEAWNVLACRRGSLYPSQYVILSAHYDHIGKSPQGAVFNGADDNGSGTAVLLEVARLISQLPPPKRTIVFFHTGAEEKGLIGAFRFVQDSLIPIDSIVAMVNTDMVGRTDTLHQPGDRYLYTIGADRATPVLRFIQEEVNALCCQWKLDYRYDSPSDPLRLFYRSDHFAFARKGVPSVFYFGGLHSDYHMPSDDWDKIEPERLRRTAVWLAAMAWSLANM